MAKQNTSETGEQKGLRCEVLPDLLSTCRFHTLNSSKGEQRRKRRSEYMSNSSFWMGVPNKTSAKESSAIDGEVGESGGGVSKVTCQRPTVHGAEATHRHRSQTLVVLDRMSFIENDPLPSNPQQHGFTSAFTCALLVRDGHFLRLFTAHVLCHTNFLTYDVVRRQHYIGTSESAAKT